MLSEEEQKAIERLEEQLNFWKKQNIKNSDCEIILNLITKLQKENKDLQLIIAKSIAERVVTDIKKYKKSNEDLKMLAKGYEIEIENFKKENEEKDKEIEKKDKQINLMADEISYLDWGNLCNRINNNCIVSIKHNPKCRECIKQYFERKSEE